MRLTKSVPSDDRVYLEALNIFGKARPIGCFLTIGTGMPVNLDMGPAGSGVWDTIFATKALISTLMGFATATMGTHLQLSQLFDFFHEGAYFRFNAGEKIDAHWVEATKSWSIKSIWGDDAPGEKYLAPDNWANEMIQLDEWDKMDQFVAFTEKYLRKPEQVRLLKECVDRMVASAK